MNSDNERCKIAVGKKSYRGEEVYLQNLSIVLYLSLVIRSVDTEEERKRSKAL